MCTANLIKFGISLFHISQTRQQYFVHIFFLLLWKDAVRLSKENSQDFVSNTSCTFLFFRWGNCYDPESELSYYEICLGKSKGECDEIDYLFVGLNTAHKFNDLKLRHKEEYYVTIKIINIVGLLTQMTSNGVKIDRTPPKPVKHMSGTSSNKMSFSGNLSLFSFTFSIIGMYTASTT